MKYSLKVVTTQYHFGVAIVFHTGWQLKKQQRLEFLASTSFLPALPICQQYDLQIGSKNIPTTLYVQSFNIVITVPSHIASICVSMDKSTPEMRHRPVHYAGMSGFKPAEICFSTSSRALRTLSNGQPPMNQGSPYSDDPEDESERTPTRQASRSYGHNLSVTSVGLIARRQYSKSHGNLLELEAKIPTNLQSNCRVVTVPRLAWEIRGRQRNSVLAKL